MRMTKPSFVFEISHAWYGLSAGLFTTVLALFYYPTVIVWSGGIVGGILVWLWFAERRWYELNGGAESNDPRDD